MARYRLKPVEVNAEVYRPGLEDGSSRQAVPVIVKGTGGSEIAPGDWIVTKADGEREVVRSSDFEMMYEPCAEEVEPHGHNWLRKGTPMRSG